MRVLVWLGMALGGCLALAAATPDQSEYFEKAVRPVLLERCSQCHNAQLRTAGLDLTTAAGFRRGGDSGPLYAVDAPEDSRLLAAIRYDSDVKMPPTSKLPGAEIEALARWIKLGAPWPGASGSGPSGRPDSVAGWTSKQTSHWAFQPVLDREPPEVRDAAWVRTAIDRFILAKLEAAGLAPAPRADALALLRRAKFDLHGLPPTEAEIESFLADEPPGAFRRLIDRLLASPRYGEKWGRHWLDVARYADSTGLDDDIKVPNAWRYRDYVLDAFNRDVPYDRFVTEQLAGDLLPPEGGGEVNRRGIVATGFLAVGTKALVQQDKVKMKYNVVDEQFDTTAKVFMGLTMGCARCHDHKFDPISTRDYYSMASIFASIKNFESLDPDLTVSQVHLEPLVPQPVYRRYREHQERIGNTKRRIRSIVDLGVLRYIMDRQGSQLAEYMLAAYDIYSGGQQAAAVAERERLDCEVLELWAEYLAPGGDFRPHLELWHAADDLNRETIAQQFEDRFESTGRARILALEDWRRAVEAWDGVGEFPEAPRDAPGSDRFFAEVTLAAASMDEGSTRVDGPFAIPERLADAILPEDAKVRAAALREQQGRLVDSAPARPPMAYAPVEGESVAQRVFIRGSHHSPGEAVPKQFPVILAGKEQQPVTHGSGRRELAGWLVSADHPLTSRVIANRLWQWHFGRGLVRTPAQLRPHRRAPHAPRVAGLPSAELGAAGLVAEGAPPIDHVLQHVPDAKPGLERSLADGSREPALVAVRPAEVGRRGTARCAPRPGRIAGPGLGRAADGQLGLLRIRERLSPPRRDAASHRVSAGLPQQDAEFAHAVRLRRPIGEQRLPSEDQYRAPSALLHE